MNGAGASSDTGRAGLAAAVALGAALGTLGLVQWAGHERAAFGGGESGGASFAEVEAALDAAGLQVCAAAEVPDGLANQAVTSRTYEVALRCSADPVAVVVDRFATARARDAAVRRFESLVRPRGSGVVYTLGDTVVSVPGSGDDGVRERLGAALGAAGAR